MTVFEMLRKLLSRREKRNLVVLFLAVIGTAVAETGGVGAVLPFVSLAANPNLVHTNKHFAHLYNLLGEPSFVTFMLIVGIAVIVVLVLGNAFSALTQYGIVRFSTMRGYSLARRLFREYLARPYDFFLATNTAELSRNVLSEVNSIVQNSIMPVLETASRVVVTLSILAFLVVINPLVAAAVILVFGGLYGTIFWLSKAKVRKLGRQRLEANRGRFKSTNEAFSSIKDVKLFHSERYFDKTFSEHSFIFAKTNASSTLIGSLPRYALEAIAFSGVVLLLLIAVGGSGGFSAAIPFVAAYAVASYKLMPALQIILRNITRARFSSPSLELVSEALGDRKQELTAESETPIPIGTIRFVDVSFGYQDRPQPAIHNVSFQVEPHTSVGIVGETGSGKTTIVDLLIGLLRPASGTVYAGEKAITPDTARAWQRQLGYVPQMISLLDDTVARNIAFGIDPTDIDMDAVKQAAAMAHIDDFIERELPEGYHTELGERGIRLSGGQRQRIGIARALYRNPEVIVFDEATSALDNMTEQAVMDAIQSIGRTKTIIMIAHRISTVRDCDSIIVMERGRIAGMGTYDELLQGNSAFRSIARKN